MNGGAATVLAMLGIVIGIAAVICMVALGNGANNMIQEQINSMGRNVLMIWPGAASSGGFSWGGGSTTTLTAEDGEALLRELPEVASVTPVVRTRAPLIRESYNWTPISIMGTGASFPDVRDWPLDEGSFFTPRDELSSTKVCVIGWTIVENLFPEGRPLGQTVRIKNVPFRVVGVLSRKGTNSMGTDQDDLVLVPWTTAKSTLEGSAFRNVSQLLVAIRSAEEIPAATEAISDVLRRRHRLPEREPDDFRVIAMSEMASTAAQTSSIMSALLAGIASISLLVGGIGIMNIMLVSVTERTREIGLRLAVGARGRDILQQFLIESVLLSGFAGLIGMGLGGGASAILADTLGWPFAIDPNAMGLAVVFSCAVGVFFGLYPAMRAARLDPIEALRYE